MTSTANVEKPPADASTRGLVRIATAASLTALIVFVLAACFYFFQFHGELSDSQTTWGAFGDFLGGTINPVLGCFSLLALVATLHLQAKQLDNSKAELAEAREEVQRSLEVQRQSAAALQEQSKVLAKQSFESTFFHLISLHHELVGGIDLRSSGEVTCVGRDCFKVFYNVRFRQTRQSMLASSQTTSAEEWLASVYARFDEHHGYEIGHYFRNLYRIFKFIDESDLENKKWYSGTVRAQLSDFELCLLFYAGLSPVGAGFRPLIERYALLENVPQGRIFDWALATELYPLEAFGSNAPQQLQG